MNFHEYKFYHIHTLSTMGTLGGYDDYMICKEGNISTNFHSLVSLKLIFQ